ncbi:hypothetical protein M408DRAFT_333564 [Serendipita vermifera MAFF 305830]|uniref:Uncharacterized protein n=1 Tax=Serendipita vermifera MAFF 305830 TaxID=933852 RepID=A0A0C2W453_SERVB|nr:hypothetical protein M408DRAFT_333564 [Serendipita vermifera MAFF 305830]
MTSKTKLCVPKGDVEIPTVSPNLMPFRIAYSGPAPISTYFLTNPFVDANEQRRLAAQAAGATNSDQANVDGENPTTATTTTAKDLVADQEDALVAAGPSHETLSSVLPGPAGVAVGDQVKTKTGETADADADNNNRLQAAFRGRRVVSHAVQLPEGYTGLLLTQRGSSSAAAAGAKGASGANERGTDKKGKGAATAKSSALKAAERAKALKAKAAAKRQASGGGSRRSPRKGAKAMEDEDGEEEIEPEDVPVKLEYEEESTATGAGEPLVEEKVFDVAGKFQGFTLWHPDVAVDNARDEYIRSVNEWISLASEIHRI